MIRGIGINCDEDTIDGHVDRLAQALDRAEQAGFDAYEFSIEACNLIRGGRVIQDEVDRVKAVLSAHSLRYTVHPPCSLQLTDRSGWGRQVFLACLDVTAQLHADVMVYHSGQIALRPADQDTQPLPDAAALQEMWRYETAMLKEIAPEAERRGVMIAVENRDPHLWELAALHRHSKDGRDLIQYHQGMRLDLLVEQVKEVASRNVGICLDVGHAFLAAPYWPNGDFLSVIRQAAPWIRHVHFHDNFGRLDDWAESLMERLVFGEADCHLPPGWGNIPLAQVLSTLNAAGYSGWLITEVRPRYMDRLAEIATNVRLLLS